MLHPYFFSEGHPGILNDHRESNIVLIYIVFKCALSVVVVVVVVYFFGVLLTPIF